MWHGDKNVAATSELDEAKADSQRMGNESTNMDSRTIGRTFQLVISDQMQRKMKGATNPI